MRLCYFGIYIFPFVCFLATCTSTRTMVVHSDLQSQLCMLFRSLRARIVRDFSKNEKNDRIDDREQGFPGRVKEKKKKKKKCGIKFDKNRKCKQRIKRLSFC